MMQSKPLIIVAAIIAAIIGIWVGLNVFTSGFAQILALFLFGGIGFLIYKGLRGNRGVEIMEASERSRILAEKPSSGARVLVYREGFVAKLSGIDVSIDGTPHAQLKSPRSVAIDIAPGDHSLIATVGGKGQPPLAFSVGEGEVAVVRIGMGIAGPEITREADGAAIRGKLAGMPMVRPYQAAASSGAAVTGSGASGMEMR